MTWTRFNVQPVRQIAGESHIENLPDGQEGRTKNIRLLQRRTNDRVRVEYDREKNKKTRKKRTGANLIYKSYVSDNRCGVIFYETNRVGKESNNDNEP